MTVSGCALWADKERFPSGYVRVIHTEQHCKEVDRSMATQLPGADRVASADWGIGRLGPTRSNWEILARQLATELDADIAVVRPCDGED